MIRAAGLSFFVLVVLLTGACSGRGLEPAPPAVAEVELPAYLGTWYAVARIPNRFERDCLQSEARYTLMESGVLKVENSCPTGSGRTKRVEGRAWVVEPSSKAKLRVGFFSVFGWYPGFTRGDYWVLALGPRNDAGLYTWALVGEPSRRYGWVLARTRSLPPEVFAEVWSAARRAGYEPSVFESLAPPGMP